MSRKSKRRARKRLARWQLAKWRARRTWGVSILSEVLRLSPEVLRLSRMTRALSPWSMDDFTTLDYWASRADG